VTLPCEKNLKFLTCLQANGSAFIIDIFPEEYPQYAASAKKVKAPFVRMFDTYHEARQALDRAKANWMPRSRLRHRRFCR
jgi:hypothetical protein